MLYPLKLCSLHWSYVLYIEVMLFPLKLCYYHWSYALIIEVIMPFHVCLFSYRPHTFIFLINSIIMIDILVEVLTRRGYWHRQYLKFYATQYRISKIVFSNNTSSTYFYRYLFRTPKDTFFRMEHYPKKSLPKVAT